MRVGLGLPNVLPGVDGRLLRSWAVRAEERDFAFLGTVGRLGWPSYDSLISLAVAAGATTRIGLFSNVVLAPLVPDLLLAKSTLALTQLSEGRLTLGLGLGARESDYRLVGADFVRRGEVFDRQLDLLHRAWAGGPVADGLPVGPAGPRPEVVIGGHGAPAVRRVVRWGDGWTGANGGVARNGPVADAVREAWRTAGRDGSPRLVALVYAALGKEAAEVGPANLAAYYAFFGEQRARDIAAGTVTTVDGLRAAVREYADAGFSDVLVSPAVADLDQVDRLADAVR